MLERIIAGILIGFVAGLFLKRRSVKVRKNSDIVLVFIALIVVAFVGSSFLFGAIYGGMAIAEIAFGYMLTGVNVTQWYKSRAEVRVEQEVAERERLLAKEKTDREAGLGWAYDVIKEREEVRIREEAKLSKSKR